MKVLIMGGSGLIGSRLVKRLRDAGHEAIAASPSSGVDSLTGTGLTPAMSGVEVLVDVTNAPQWEDAAVMSFFQTSTRNLLAAAKTAGVKHFVALSVVGADRNTSGGYMRAKVAQEALIRVGGVPFTVVRATQFFEFLNAIAASGVRGEAVHLPSALMQPIAADDVADALARVTLDGPVNGVIELAGPDKLPMTDLVRRLFAATNDSRPVVVDDAAGYFGMEIDDRSLTPDDDARIGPTRFDQWLAAR